jgi:hypothetical protein
MGNSTLKKVAADVRRLSTNQHMKLQILIWLVALASVLTSCGADTKPEYYFGFINKTGHDLGDVAALYGSRQVARKGGLVKDGEATEGPVRLAIPQEAIVQWSANGASHTVKVKLDSAVLRDFNGTLYFVIEPDDSVIAKTEKSH